MPFLLNALPAQAQQQAPRLPHAGYIFPAGAAQGAAIDVRIGGQNLMDAEAIYVSGVGLQATPGMYFRPPAGKELIDLRNKFRDVRQQLIEEGVRVPAQPALLLRSPAIADVAKAMGMSTEHLKGFIKFVVARRDPKKQINPQLQEWIVAHVTVDPQASPGERELRVVTPRGLSNPIRFEVGRYAEAQRAEQTGDSVDEIERLPVVLNGQILPGEVHRYSFAGRKGMKFVAAVSAESLMPYLADAVPGWFQPTVTLYDTKGEELAVADHFQFRVDPMVCCALPADGPYTLEIRDALYRGREDFVYRVTMGEIPVVTSVFPLGGRSSGTTTVQTRGWNLEQTQQTLEGGTLGTGIHTIALGGIDSGDYQFQVDRLPECSQLPSSAADGRAQPIPMPIVINGCVRRSGETDAYRFTAKAGQTIVAEVMARRLGSQLDSILSLTDSTGKQIAYNDDFEDKAFGLLTHQADSRIMATIPKSGSYLLRIRDAANKGGEEYGYRLRVSPPMPDYELRISPSSITVRAGTTVPVTVYAIRRDGFAGEIDLKLMDAPDRLVLRGGRISAGKDSATVTFTAPVPRLLQPVPLHVEGTAVIGGHDVTHSAVPADDMMQAFAYHHLVPAHELVLDVLPRGQALPIAAVSDTSPLWLIPGGVTQLRLAGVRGTAASQLEFVLQEAPEGISIEDTKVDAEGVLISIRADAAKVKPGLKGSIILAASRVTTSRKSLADPTLVKRLQPLGILPAVAFDAVAR